jgi:uncharacterized protein YjeT (DUF2065 family)
MARARIGLLIALCGLIGVISPSGVTETLDFLPHISDATPVRPVGAVYLIAGGLIAWNVHAGRPNRSTNVLGVVVACAVGLQIAFRGNGPAPDLEFFAPALCVLFPLAVGVAESFASVRLSAAAAFLLILGGMRAYEPAFANAMGDLTIAFFAGLWAVFGIPLYFVGREWRVRVPDADGQAGDPA